MPDDQKNETIPEAFGSTADHSVAAGIADEVAGYDQAMQDKSVPAADDRSPDEMEDPA